MTRGISRSIIEYLDVSAMQCTSKQTFKCFCNSFHKNKNEKKKHWILDFIEKQFIFKVGLIGFSQQRGLHFIHEKIRSLFCDFNRNRRGCKIISIQWSYIFSCELFSSSAYNSEIECQHLYFNWEVWLIPGLSTRC